MNFQVDTTPSTGTGSTDSKPAEQKPAEVVPVSRVFSDAKLWAEAFELADMLTFCRPDKSRTERKFIGKYITPLGVHFDKRGNIYKQIGTDPTVLWSCHTDTVHNFNGFQKVAYWPEKKTGDIFLEVDHRGVTGFKSSCLGADDTCGIWLMIQMIKANRPGLYIFHRSEEVASKGSKWIADNNPTALKGIKFAIAFDRKGTKSVITYQRGKRCCSDAFAKSLAAELGMGHECDTGGSFTDTASYVDLIPECTNVSVGYELAHCSTEHTNIDYLFNLRDALLKLDVSKLVEERKPGESPSLYGGTTYYGDGKAYGGFDDDIEWFKDAQERGKAQGGLTGVEVRRKCSGMTWLDKYEFDQDVCLWFPKGQFVKSKKQMAADKKQNGRKTDLGVTKQLPFVGNGVKAHNTVMVQSSMQKDGTKPTYMETLRMIRDNDMVIADLLESLGYGPSELKDHLLDVGATGNVIRL